MAVFKLHRGVSHCRSVLEQKHIRACGEENILFIEKASMPRGEEKQQCGHGGSSRNKDGVEQNANGRGGHVAPKVEKLLAEVRGP